MDCARSFPARLADAKAAVAAHAAHQKRYEAARPAVEWFEAHCRFLTELERAVRQADDPAAFVCDPKAPGRPASLNRTIVQYAVQPTIGQWQKRHGENHLCLEQDRRERIGLVFAALTDIERLELLCWDDPRERCVKARETIRKVRAKAR
jgi:hypothetical protein